MFFYIALCIYIDWFISSPFFDKDINIDVNSANKSSSYWNYLQVPSSNGESNSFIPGEEANCDVEPVVREMKGREAIRIVDLYKSYHRKCKRLETKAVNGINLTIYEGQITAILGHNGAGKTTLFNILTGLTAPTAGTALIFGYDVRDSNDMRAIRSMTGVCPQHDILFDLLTPREHLEFFAAVRGIPRSMIQQEVRRHWSIYNILILIQHV